MECPYCKAENRDGVQFCGSCGNQLPTSSSSISASSGSNSLSRSLGPGARLQGGRYVIKKILGQGGMGAALLATDNRLDGKAVVIKELVSDNTDPARLQDDVRNFKREVALLAHIDHPLVPNVTDHFQEEGSRYFMVQEYVDGENLEDRMERVKQPMLEREALICASELLDVLDYLAKQMPPIVHRDIKPANVIIGSKDRRAHLVDFGIARADVARNAQRKQTSALGTPGYAPPEQYQGNADPRSDLYALAATLHHLLTNRDPRNYPPFTYPLSRTLNPQLSPDIEQVLTRALHNDITQRYQSALAMKMDIDDILRKRFGISGNINSYMLGVSGPMGTVNSSSAEKTFAPAGPNTLNIDSAATMRGQTVTTGGVGNPSRPFVNPNTPSQLPPQSWPYSQPNNMQGYPSNSMPIISQLPPQNQHKRPLWLYALLLLLLLVIIVGGVFAATNLLKPGTSNATPTTTKAIGVTKVGNDYIGISDGTFNFDTGAGRSDSTLKQQAAAALARNDSGTALSLYSQAISTDTNDAEAHIYLEDLRVLSSGSSYVTIVVGTVLAGTDSDIGTGRDDLQGAYVAQKEFNDGSKLSGGFKVRLLIASSASKTAYASDVANQIVQLAKKDASFVGVVGWPYSTRSVEAIKILGAAHIPMVSQTSSSDALTNISPYFFRVVPANNIQGVTGAHYAETTLQANTAALFVDTGDTYSQSLASDFKTKFTADGKQVVVTENYKVGHPETLGASLQDALNHNPDVIYFAGFASDVSTLLTDLPPSNTTPIMGGDALYQLHGYSTSARAGFSHLHFTTFAYPDEWGVLGYGSKKPAFFSEYPAAFDPNSQHTGSPYGYSRADNDVILSYDATIALLYGCNNALAAGKQTVTPESLRQGLTQIQGANALQGVSGQIAFMNGEPVNKAIVILAVDQNGHIKMELPVQGTFLKSV